MKKYMLLSLFAFVIASGCKKNIYKISDPDRDNFGYGSYLKLVNADNTLLDYTNLSSSTLSVKVTEIGGPVSKINLYVVAGGEDTDTSHWKFVKTISGTGGENTLSVKAQEIADALGISLTDFNPGDVYTIYTEVVTTKGVKFTINNANADLAGGPAIAAVFLFKGTVFCAYDPATTDNVQYEVVNDDWADFQPGDVITVINGPAANQITLQGVYATTINHKDLVVDISPDNGAATIESQVNGTYPGFPYGDISASGDGFIFSCQGIINLNISLDVSLGNLGVVNLKLRKL